MYVLWMCCTQCSGCREVRVCANNVYVRTYICIRDMIYTIVNLSRIPIQAHVIMHACMCVCAYICFTNSNLQCICKHMCVCIHTCLCMYIPTNVPQHH